MTEDELMDHVTKQSATIETQGKELQAKEAAIAELKEKTSVFADLTPESLKELQEKAAAGEEAVAKVAELTSANEQAALEKEFPAITDWSVVVGDTLEAKREHAGKIAALIPAAKPKLDAEGKPIVEKKEDQKPGDKGDLFKGAPQTGGGDLDSEQQAAKDKVVADMGAAAKANNIAGVLDGCMELQPKATEALFQHK
jgi:hypothetical protein